MFFRIKSIFPLRECRLSNTNSIITLAYLVLFKTISIIIFNLTILQRRKKILKKKKESKNLTFLGINCYYVGGNIWNDHKLLLLEPSKKKKTLSFIGVHNRLKICTASLMYISFWIAWFQLICLHFLSYCEMYTTQGQLVIKKH